MIAARVSRRTPHDAVSWGLLARAINANYLAKEEDGWESGSSILYGFTEAMRIVMVGELTRDIELTLKESIERLLKRRGGDSWWNHLPAPVRRRARHRRNWSAEQLGQRRILGEKNTAWLSMGDVLQVLRGLSSTDWQKCLKSETLRRRDTDRAFRKVKAYRDYHLAHPKPRRTTLKEQAQLCSTVAALPAYLCPQEWEEVEALLAKARALPPRALSDLRREATPFIKSNEQYLQRWLACPDLMPPEICAHDHRLGKVMVHWRREVLSQCESFDSGGNVFLKTVI